jgi:NTE family protein
MKRDPEDQGTTALVLSGGCLRGLAQIGVLKALHAAGVRPGLVVGTSVGAVVGALYAAGCSREEIERAALGVDIARLKTWAFSRHGLWRLDGLQSLLRRQLPQRRIEDFPVRFAAVATDTGSGQAVVFTRGDASEAVAASAAMPGFFVPPVVEGRRCVDGCLVSPLPVRIARALGATRVIAVDTLCDPTPLRRPVLLDRMLAPARLMMRALAATEADEADALIAPELGTIDVSAPEHRQAAIDAGERAAERYLSPLR